MVGDGANYGGRSTKKVAQVEFALLELDLGRTLKMVVKWIRFSRYVKWGKIHPISIPCLFGGPHKLWGPPSCEGEKTCNEYRITSWKMRGYEKSLPTTCVSFAFLFPILFPLELTDWRQPQITYGLIPNALHCIFLCFEHHANNTNLIAAMSKLKSPF